MAQVGKTVVYPVKGVTVFLPGGAHGFTGTDLGVPMPNDHAGPLLAIGHLQTAAQRKAATDLAAAEVEKAKAEQEAAVPAAASEPTKDAAGAA